MAICSTRAIEYHKQHMSIAKEVGDRAGEEGTHGNLGNVYQCLGDISNEQKNTRVLHRKSVTGH